MKLIEPTTSVYGPGSWKAQVVGTGKEIILPECDLKPAAEIKPSKKHGGGI